MAQRATWTPDGGYSYPASNFPALVQDSGTRRMVWSFDAATDETILLTGVAPAGLTGTLTLVVKYRMASATSGAVYFGAAVEAITTEDALDTGTSSFGAINTAGETVPGTAGYTSDLTITLTNNDSLAAGDYYRIEFRRDADNASDTATGDAQVLSIEFKDGA